MTDQTFNLSKDQPVFDLTKAAPSTTQLLVAGCSWKTKMSSSGVDIDLSVIACDARDNKVEIAYFGNCRKDLLGGALFHFGDDLTGSDAQTDTDNEQVRIHLDKMPANVVALYVMASLYSGSMNQISSCNVCIRDSTNAKVINADMDSLSSRAVMLAKIVRDNNEWKVELIDGGMDTPTASGALPYIKGSKTYIQPGDIPGETEEKKGFFSRMFS